MTTIGNNFLSLTGTSRILGVNPVDSEYTGGGSSSTPAPNVNLESKIGMGPCYTHIPGEGYRPAAKVLDFGA